jgi:hypothetical protein
MKIILTFLLITLFLASCKKGSSGNQSTPDYFLHFKANGQGVVFDGDVNGSQNGAVWAEKLTFSTYKQLVVHGVGDGFNNVLMLFNVDSVRSGQAYTFDDLGDGSFIVAINGREYRTLPGSSVNSQCEVIVNVQRHSEGLISGTFSGKVAAPNINGGYDVVTVTAGSFNSKVIYR